MREGHKDARTRPRRRPRAPAKRTRWGEEEQGSGRSFDEGKTEQSGLCDDEAGPVIVFGTLASVIYGVILMLVGEHGQWGGTLCTGAALSRPPTQMPHFLKKIELT